MVKRGGGFSIKWGISEKALFQPCICSINLVHGYVILWLHSNLVIVLFRGIVKAKDVDRGEWSNNKKAKLIGESNNIKVKLMEDW